MKRAATCRCRTRSKRRTVALASVRDGACGTKKNRSARALLFQKERARALDIESPPRETHTCPLPSSRACNCTCCGVSHYTELPAFRRCLFHIITDMRGRQGRPRRPLRARQAQPDHAAQPSRACETRRPTSARPDRAAPSGHSGRRRKRLARVCSPQPPFARHARRTALPHL